MRIVLTCWLCLTIGLVSAQSWDFTVPGQITTTDKVQLNNQFSALAPVGIGTNAEAGTALIVKTGDWSDWMQLRSLAHGYWSMHNPQAEDRLSFYYRDAANVYTFNVLNLMNNGSVGINTQCVPSGYKLAVKGKVICEEVVVKLEGGNCWADFVFEKDYKLRPLLEVEQYINKNKHLPEVPSAKEVEEQGLSLQEMMRIQMQKIEELTLYMIELKKENDLLKQKLDNLSTNK